MVIERHRHPDERHQQQHHDGQIEADSADRELRYQPAQELHRRIGDRKDDLENHDREAAGCQSRLNDRMNSTTTRAISNSQKMNSAKPMMCTNSVN